MSKCQILKKNPLYRKTYSKKHDRWIYQIDLRTQKFWNGKQIISSFDKRKTDSTYEEVKYALTSKTNLEVFEEFKRLNEDLKPFKTDVSTVVTEYLKTVNVSELTFSQLIDKYIIYSKNRLKEGQSVNTTLSTCELIKKSVLGKLKISEVNHDQIKSYLDKLKWTERTKKNHLIRIKAIINYGMKCNIFESDPTKLITIKVPHQDPEIITTNQFIEMLHACPNNIVTSILLLKSLGIRSNEILKTDFEKCYNIKEHTLIISKSVSKTATSRMIPLQMLKHWKDWYLHFGGIETLKQIDEFQMRKYRKLINKCKCGQNKLRHSAITYHCVLTKFDIQSASVVFGNSAPVLKRYYLGLVSLQTHTNEAENWFNIHPDILTEK
jgi:hypothetical protein